MQSEKICYELPVTPETKVFGPKYWEAFHDLANRIPCGNCRQAGSSFMVFFHDLVNMKLGKPIYNKENFDGWVEKIKNLKVENGGCINCAVKNPEDKDLNTHKTNKIVSERMADLTQAMVTLGGGQLAGRTVQELTSFANRPAFGTNMPMSTFLNLALGIGAVVLATWRDSPVKGANAQLATAVAGTKLVVDEVIDLVAPMIKKGAGVAPTVISSLIPRSSHNDLIRVDV